MRWRILSSIFLISSFTTLARCSVIDNQVERYMYRGECHLPPGLLSEIRGYQPLVNSIIDKIVNGHFAGDTYQSLLEMTDKFGPRIAGSQALEDTIDYMVNEFEKAGLENVHTQDAVVPHWVRGSESAEMISPRRAKFNILGLGLSVGTPRGGILGQVIVVETFDELESLPDEMVSGKIVVFVPKWEGYGKTVDYRERGANYAAKKGAVATLIRSMTPFSIGSPHAGVTEYDDGIKKIPTACLTVEDAMMLLRLYRKGERITIHFEMEAKILDPVISRNTIGELRGTYSPNRSVVVVSGHLDSWDIGVGALDDAGGCFISWKAVQYLKQMGLRPKRTIRSIMWTGEEFGYLGAHAYQKQHAANEKEEFNFFIESDIGVFEPSGMGFSGSKDAECIFREILNLMAPLNATQIERPPKGGPDVSLWYERGFPAATLIHKSDKYFWFHHTAGDSMLILDPVALDKGAAIFAATAFVLADLSIDIPKTVHGR